MVDIYTLVALLAGIALAAYFLRLALVKKLGRRKRDVTVEQLTAVLDSGRRDMTCSRWVFLNQAIILKIIT